jgi:hypothetical protein
MPAATKPKTDIPKIPYSVCDNDLIALEIKQINTKENSAISIIPIMSFDFFVLLAAFT